MDFVSALRDYLCFKYPGSYIAEEEYLDGQKCRMVVTQPNALSVTLWMNIDPCWTVANGFCERSLGVSLFEFVKQVELYRKLPPDLATELTEETKGVCPCRK